jgi:hypothetical protein
MTGTNNFQIELFYDGRIRMTWLDLATAGGVAGLSRGNGVPVNYTPSDLGGYGPCFQYLHPPDFDDDGDVDSADATIFAHCMSGSEAAPIPGCEPDDLDLDADVDQSDFALLQRCFSGSDVPADPDCTT